MVVKSFNVDEENYRKFSEFCRANGISMSRQIDTFMASIVEHEPKAKREYLAKLDAIRQGRFVKVSDFGKRYTI